MTRVVSSGHLATIVFGTSGFAANVREIGGWTEEREDLDASHLSTVSRMRFLPSALTNPGEFEVEFIFEPNAAGDTPAGVTVPPVGGAPETITITFPKGANTNGATVAGTGYVKSWTAPTLVHNQLMVGRMTIKWEGGSASEPAYTAAT